MPCFGVVIAFGIDRHLERCGFSGLVLLCGRFGIGARVERHTQVIFILIFVAFGIACPFDMTYCLCFAARITRRQTVHIKRDNRKQIIRVDNICRGIGFGQFPVAAVLVGVGRSGNPECAEKADQQTKDDGKNAFEPFHFRLPPLLFFIKNRTAKVKPETRNPTMICHGIGS